MSTLEKEPAKADRKPVTFTVQDGTAIIQQGQPGELRGQLLDTTGTTNPKTALQLLQQVIATLDPCASQEGPLNAAVDMLNGIRPKDTIEGMLGAQMVGVHHAAMDCLSRAAACKDVNGQQLYTRQATKLLNTFAKQLETLQKYRTGGQQSIHVQHVHVHQGGQAVVGTVQGGGGHVS